MNVVLRPFIGVEDLPLELRLIFVAGGNQGQFDADGVRYRVDLGLFGVGHLSPTDRNHQEQNGASATRIHGAINFQDVEKRVVAKRIVIGSG
ncbi:hypothetical protein [Anatilimnocola aggregata]|uniref:hypothetical protein n=1 Tax=Anatilimnocola aggregata TaxID=2528021 RepID=UPI00119DFA38|nr:hypothetical protein [Anatilimnocola aggregata]